MDDVVVWTDGRLVGAAQARVPALDHGLTVGDGVFETCKVTPAGPFALTRHLRRLARSAEGLGLEAPDEAQVRAAVAEVVGVRPVTLGRLRITWTAGAGPLGSDRVPGAGTLVVALAPARPWPATTRAAVVPWVRNERGATVGLKTTSYAENVVALARAQREGGSEALLANTRGELCEGTGSNVAVVVDDELLTPPLTSGCLAGITRELLLEWATQEGLGAREQDLPLDVLDRAPAVVLTSSTRDVQVLAGIGTRDLPGHPLADEASALFARRAAEDLDP